MDIDAVLLDIDGVLAVSWEPISGATETVEWLRRRGLAFRFVTNTSSESRRGIARKLTEAGIPVEPAEVITAVVATGDYLRVHHPGAKVFVLSDKESLEDLGPVELVERGADVVVVGGAGEIFSYEHVNRAFQMLMGGAAFVAVHRSMYWKTSEGLELDGGAYIRGLEEATGVRAVVCGKPAPAFFEAALHELGATADRVAMVGDDVVTDVLAAKALGSTGILTKTGKFRPQDLERPEGTPDHVIGSIADLPALLGPS